MRCKVYLRKPSSMVKLVKKLGKTQPISVERDPEPLQTEGQAAEYLGFTQRALQSWRSRGGGPRYVRVSSRAIRYRRCDLDAWIMDRLHNDASEYRDY
jgi:predicted DNA-binding transcriptional regulator AlpA